MYDVIDALRNNWGYIVTILFIVAIVYGMKKPRKNGKGSEGSGGSGGSPKVISTTSNVEAPPLIKPTNNDTTGGSGS